MSKSMSLDNSDKSQDLLARRIAHSLTRGVKIIFPHSTNRIDFKHPIPTGTLLEIEGRVSELGLTSLKIQVKVFMESMYTEDRILALNGEFTFVAVDKDRSPIPILTDIFKGNHDH